MKNIEELIINNHEKLYKIAAKYLRNHDDILDTLQETAFKAIKNSHKIKNEKFTMTWIIRILINNCLYILKKKKKVEFVELDENYYYANADSANADSANATIEITEWLLKIKKNYRDVIVLKYIEGYKIREIAEIYSRPESTIKTWLKRGLEMLKSEGTYYE